MTKKATQRTPAPDEAPTIPLRAKKKAPAPNSAQSIDPSMLVDELARAISSVIIYGHAHALTGQVDALRGTLMTHSTRISDLVHLRVGSTGGVACRIGGSASPSALEALASLGDHLHQSLGLWDVSQDGGYMLVVQGLLRGDAARRDDLLTEIELARAQALADLRCAIPPLTPNERRVLKRFDEDPDFSATFRQIQSMMRGRMSHTTVEKLREGLVRLGCLVKREGTEGLVRTELGQRASVR